MNTVMKDTKIIQHGNLKFTFLQVLVPLYPLGYNVCCLFLLTTSIGVNNASNK